jgi:hypothetical protein
MNRTLGAAPVEKRPENLPEEVCSRTFANSAVIGKCARCRQPVTEATGRDRPHVKCGFCNEEKSASGEAANRLHQTSEEDEPTKIS